jgi:two-component system, OmpR family, alkaline phosphatase synthesis response regulator PhoP
MSAAILVIEDEPNLGEGIREVLESEGYQADWEADGTQGFERAYSGDYDLVILDVMLPGIDGFTICERLRQEEKDTPILFLSAKGSAADRIRGLQLGGDDYLPKPFRLEELLLRVQAILRRRRREQGPAPRRPVRFGENSFDPTTFRAVSWDGTAHVLTQREAMILMMLLDNPNKVVARDEVLEHVWGRDVFPSSRTVDNFIVRLRKRFEVEPTAPVFFHTVRGVGYRFTPGEE